MAIENATRPYRVRYTGTGKYLRGLTALGRFGNDGKFFVQVDKLSHRYAHSWWQQNPANWFVTDAVSAATDVAIAYYDAAVEKIGWSEIEFVWNGIANGCNQFPCDRDEVIERFAERKAWPIEKVRGALRA
jgi:hypothetical protein